VSGGAAEHLAFDHLDAVDGSCDGTGAVGQCQPGGDGVEVPAQAAGEGSQGWGAVGVDSLEPAVKFLAAALGADRGERLDLVVSGTERGAAGLWGSKTRLRALTPRLQAARSYSLISPPRTGRRLDSLVVEIQGGMIRMRD
jgi:hypothetical protein